MTQEMRSHIWRGRLLAGCRQSILEDGIDDLAVLERTMRRPVRDEYRSATRFTTLLTKISAQDFADLGCYRQAVMELTFAADQQLTRTPVNVVELDRDELGRSWNGNTARDRPAFPPTPAISLAMKGISLDTLTHPRLDRAHLHPPLRQRGRRVLAAPTFEKAANQRKFLDPLSSARPFIPSSPCHPNTRLRAEQIGGWTSRAIGRTPETTRTFPDLGDQARISDVIQDSDFPWEIALRFSSFKKPLSPRVRRTTRRTNSLSDSSTISRRK